MHTNRNGIGKSFTRLAGAVVILGVMAGGCDAIFPKKVKEEDCDKWVGHVFDVAKDEFESAIKTCPDDLKKQMKKGSDKALDKEKDKAVKKCKKHVDEKYESKEADCFMKAANFKDLKACKFKVTDDKDDKDDDKDPAAAFDKLKKMCDKAGGKAKADDDAADDDAKAKKKGDDDDN